MSRAGSKVTSRIGMAVLTAAVVMTAGAVVYAGRAPDQLDVPDRRPVDVATTQAVLACPRTSDGKSTESSLFAVAPVAPGGRYDEPGSLSSSVLADAPSARRDAIQKPGQPIVRPLTREDEPSLVVSASGPMSAGLVAAQWSVETGKSTSGTSATWCQPSADDWWFAGVSTSVGSTTELVLTNSTPAIAVADLRFFGPDGPVEAVGERGIAIAPNSQESLSLGRFAPGLDDLTVNVHAATGRVTAAVSTSLTSGVTPVGTEWIPAADIPSEAVVVDAGFAAADSQALEVTNPGEREALVEVQVVDDSGAFTPAGLDDLRVAPGDVATEDLTDVVDKSASAVLLTSTVPVTGAIVSTTSRPDDVAVTAPSPVLSAPAVVPVLDGLDLEIAFSSAVRKGGAVQIAGFSDAGGSTVSESLNLEGQTTTTWVPDKRDDAAYYVVTMTVDGQTHAVAQYTADDGITSLPVLPGRFVVSQPDVRQAR